MSITADGGYILISVPYRYRIHHDPIDNGFRPTPGEILALFPSAQITCVAKAIISITDPFYYGIKIPVSPLGLPRKDCFLFGQKAQGVRRVVPGKNNYYVRHCRDVYV